MSEEKQDTILKITLNEKGGIRVDGPITNEMLSFYMLEKAKDIIKGHNLQLAIKEKQSKITQPGGIMNFVKGGKRF